MSWGRLGIHTHSLKAEISQVAALLGRQNAYR